MTVEDFKNMTVNERIKLLRKNYLHKSQTEFANEIGMKQTSVSTFERPGASVSDYTIKSISMAFRVNEIWLRTGEGKIPLDAEPFSLDRYLKEKGCTALEMEIVRAYFELDLDTRKKVFEHFHSRLEAAKERLAAGNTPASLFSDSAPLDAPAKPRSIQEMTPTELHEELDRQLLMEKNTEEKSEAS